MLIIANKAQDIKNLDPKFGVEIDVRDFHGLPMVEDGPIKKSCPILNGWIDDHPDHPIYAIHVQSDGLHNQIVDILEKKVPNRWFVYGMSFQSKWDFYHYGAPIAETASEYEGDTGFEKIKAVWSVKMHPDEGSDLEHISYLNYDKAKDIPVYFSSPDVLSPSSQMSFVYWWWERAIKDVKVKGICTNYINEAWEYFQFYDNEF